MRIETLEQRLGIQGVDLNGEWLGFYTGHYDEVVRIIQDGDYVEAVKITGEDRSNSPANGPAIEPDQHFSQPAA